MPRALSPRGILCPMQGQGGTASMAVTSGLMPPPCLGAASLPSHGAAARPRPGVARAISRGHFPSHEGLVADGPGQELCPRCPYWSAV